MCRICLRHTLQDGKSQFWHAAANKCCGSGPCPSFQNCAWAQRKRNEKVPAIILCILYNTMSCILYNNILCCVCYTMHCFVFSLYTILFPKDSNILESYLYDCFRVNFWMQEKNLTLFPAAYWFTLGRLKFTHAPAKNNCLSVRFQFFYTFIEIYVQLAKIKK